MRELGGLKVLYRHMTIETPEGAYDCWFDGRANTLTFRQWGEYGLIGPVETETIDEHGQSERFKDGHWLILGSIETEEDEMQDKDQQSEEFEHELTVASLRGLGEDINACMGNARAVADAHIQRGTGGRELSLAITNLQQARMWVHEALAELEKALERH